MKIRNEDIVEKKIPEDVRIVKRDGKKEVFNKEKIVVAIKKGFDSVKDTSYTETDVNKVFNAVCEGILEMLRSSKSLKIEDIQSMIESKLEELGYSDICKSFHDYRERRKLSREYFTTKQHKFLKLIENISIKDSEENDTKRENANVDGNSAMGTMLQYGSAISKEFAKAYLTSNKVIGAHESGLIHLHDLDFMAMGTTTCCQIDLSDLFKRGFSTGHGHLRTPNDIMSYTALAAIAIQSNQNDQHGGQSIPAFDYFMAPGVLKTFKKNMKQTVYDYLDFSDMLNFIDFEKVVHEIDKINSIAFDISVFDKFCKETSKIKDLFKKFYEKSLAKTDRTTYQAMEAFIHNLNTMNSRAGAQVPFSSINFGTDVSPEGRMVIKNVLLAIDSGLGKGETAIFPISIFKVKEGINYNDGDVNYDLFKMACKVSAKRLFPNFSFIDAPFNLQYYKPGDYKTEIAYMGCRTRVIGNVHDKNKEIITGRGNLSFTSINLPRLGIKYGIAKNDNVNMESFFTELTETMDLVKDQLLERFEIQGNKRVKNFPFLMGQGTWVDSKGLKPNDKLKKVLKNGTLTVGFIGLAECLKALIGSHHGESEKAQDLGLEIIRFMREKCDEYAQKYKLNFSLIATPAEGLSGRFTAIDKSIYGEIEGVTDREYYTNSFHVPAYYQTTVGKKITLEAPYHALTNAGHITYIELDGDATDNVEAFESIVRIMKESGIGYGAINHPVDRDPVCGFTGVIGDVCPGCNRTEEDGIKFERIRRITGYLVGTVDRFNNGKKAEEHDRVKHQI